MASGDHNYDYLSLSSRVQKYVQN